MKILKQIKTWGLATALVGSSVAFADWWCNHCGRNHQGLFCPAQTLSCDPYGCAYGYGCGPYGCSTQAWDSGDEDDYIQDLVRKRRQHHQQTVSRLCQEMHRLRTPGDVAQVQAALDQRKGELGMPIHPMPGFHGGYGCQPGFGYGCQYYGGGFGCDDDYGYNCNHYGYQCDPYGCYYY